MARSDSENRKSNKMAGTRLTLEEHAYVLAESDRTGIAVSDRIRAALLNDPAPRCTAPTNHKPHTSSPPYRNLW